MIDYKSLGIRIRRYRTAKNWNQDDLAAKAGYSNATISHIECGKANPQLDTIVDIANALEVTTDMLLCDSLMAAKLTYQNELAEFLNTCNANELRLINDTSKQIIETMRRAIKHTKHSGDEL